jgi:putative membrane protein
VGVFGADDMGSTEGFLSESLTHTALASRAAELALEKTKSKEVRQFASKSIAEQKKYAPRLADLGWSNRVPVLIAQGKGQDISNERIAHLRGADFDRAYLKLMIEHDERWAEVVRRATVEGATAERALAVRILPALREQTREAKRLLSSLK